MFLWTETSPGSLLYLELKPIQENTLFLCSAAFMKCQPVRLKSGYMQWCKMNEKRTVANHSDATSLQE